VCLGVLLVCGDPVAGAPSGLIQIPTADVVEREHGCIDVSGALPTKGGTGLSDWAFRSDFGIPGSVELGFDTPLGTLKDRAFCVNRVLGDSAGAVGVNGMDSGGKQCSKSCRRAWHEVI
jgi:hypothetical protein